MTKTREMLEKEIADLQKRIDSNHFGGLFNQAQLKKEMNHLAKLKKELAKMQAKK
jgi:hypothetical protein